MEWLLIGVVLLILAGLSRQAKPVEQTKLKDIPKALVEGAKAFKELSEKAEQASASILIQVVQQSNQRNIKQALPLDSLNKFIDRVDLPVKDRAYVIGINLLNQEDSLPPNTLEQKHEALLAYISNLTEETLATDYALKTKILRVLTLIPTDEQVEQSLAFANQQRELHLATQATKLAEARAKLDSARAKRQPAEEEKRSLISVPPNTIISSKPVTVPVSTINSKTLITTTYIPTTQITSFKTFYLNHVEQFKQEITDWKSAYSNFINRSDKAKKPLLVQQDLLVYMIAYGYTHHLAFLSTLTYSPKTFFNPQLSNYTLVDYGCGQGIATLAFLDYLAQQSYTKHLNIILIDPSKIALNNAQNYIKNYAKERQIPISITTHVCYFDELATDFLKRESPHTQEYIHLFSNVLDILNWDYFDPKQLIQKMKRISTKHHIIASSPITQNVINTKQSLNNFLALLQPVVYGEGCEHRITEGLFYNMQMQSVQTSARSIYRIYATWGNYD